MIWLVLALWLIGMPWVSRCLQSQRRIHGDTACFFALIFWPIYTPIAIILNSLEW